MASRLARESSAYLRQHADNPVDWYPWGEEAHRAAREADRPILLSVGYSACHWCHVMAHESFEDPEIARVLNEGFVSIKVDREERPDIDHLYQGAAQLLEQSGGWPLTVFLTPDLRPFFAGTYFPPEDMLGRPGLPRVLAAVLDAWSNRRGDLTSTAQELCGGLRMLMDAGLDTRQQELEAADVVVAGERLAREIDPVHGGFGEAPKFPSPAALEAMLRSWRRSRDKAILSSVLRTLDAMAEGGLFDQVGGGFHRYSVDAAWRVPHFEKMLYDNGQLLGLYAQAQQIRPSRLYEHVVVETVGWLEREMTSPHGAFFTSQDADSAGEEGRFFAWTPTEIAEASGDEGLAALLCRRFGVSARGNFERGSSVLALPEPIPSLARSLGLPEPEVAARIERGRRLLFAARERRAHPGRDEKILAGWNGLAIEGLALAARAFGRPKWAALAARAADDVLATMVRQGRLDRVRSGGGRGTDGQLEDYGDLSQGLVQLYMATFEPRYLEAAAGLAARAIDLFWDREEAAFLAAPRDREQLFVRVWAVHDIAWPSGASTRCEALLALASLSGDPARLEHARWYLERLRGPMLRNPFGFGRLWCAADTLLDGMPALRVAGTREEARPLLEEVDRHFAPTLALAWKDRLRDPPPLLAQAFASKPAPPGRAAAYLCRSFSCAPPTHTADDLGVQLQAAVP
ncbi:MAG: thioredoxin domain-containing protein [Deltaproteobacteria bacterium]|nr:thioredoxin domain-containing protein [Deltaproteobacteria bacterium]